MTVALGAVLAPLNSTMIAVALPNIADDLGGGAAATGWLVTAYLIAMASLQPVAGRLGDRLGRRHLILGGLIGFGLTSLGATVASSLPLLILFRVGQAVSGAVVLPNGDALLRAIVPDARRAGRFGMIGSAIGLAAAVGPPLGGVLVSTVGWRVMFAVNLLLVLPALLLGWRCIPRNTGPRESGRGGAFDWPGALMLSMILVGLAALLSRGGAVVSGQAAMFAVATLVVVLAVFLRRELRHPEPVLQLRFFGRPAFAAATGAVGLSNLAMYSVLLALPLVWARAGHASVQIGSMLGVMAVAMVVGAPIGGHLADRFGRRWPTVCGLAALTLGAVQVALTAESTPSASLLGLAALGGGLGLATPGLQVSALEAVERRHAGAASGAYSTSRYLGSIVGSALLAGLAGASTADSVASIFIAVVAAAMIATLLALGLPHRPTRAAT
jgi:EmrB/QacA subfamily drug resistance transporter